MENFRNILYKDIDANRYTFSTYFSKDIRMPNNTQWLSQRQLN